MNEISCFNLEVRRDPIQRLVQDTFRQLQNATAQDMIMPLRVKFVGEDGVDDGGVRKELFRLLSLEVFNPQFAMFVACEGTRALWFNVGGMELGGV